jgi:hypothetical protein
LQGDRNNRADATAGKNLHLGADKAQSGKKHAEAGEKSEEIGRLKILLGLVAEQAEGVRKEVKKNKT